MRPAVKDVNIFFLFVRRRKDDSPDSTAVDWVHRHSWRRHPGLLPWYVLLEGALVRRPLALALALGLKVRPAVSRHLGQGMFGLVRDCSRGCSSQPTRPNPLKLLY